MADLISSVAIFPDWGSDKETNKMATRIFPVMSFLVWRKNQQCNFIFRDFHPSSMYLFRGFRCFLRQRNPVYNIGIIAIREPGLGSLGKH